MAQQGGYPKGQQGIRAEEGVAAGPLCRLGNIANAAEVRPPGADTSLLLIAWFRIDLRV